MGQVPGQMWAGVSPVPLQMWHGRAQSRGRCGGSPAKTKRSTAPRCAYLTLRHAPLPMASWQTAAARGATVQHELRRAARHNGTQRINKRARETPAPPMRPCPPALLLGPSHSQARATRTTCTVHPSAAQTGLRAHVTRASGCDCACSVRTKRGARAPVREERRKFPEGSGPHARTHARTHPRRGEDEAYEACEGLQAPKVPDDDGS